YLKYQNKELPLIIDYSVIKRIAIKQNITTLKDITNVDLESFEALEDLMFYSLQRGHKLENIEFTISPDDIEDIFSSCSGDFMKTVAEGMVSAFGPTGAISDKKKEARS